MLRDLGNRETSAMEMLKPPLDAPSAHHPDIDMTQKGITIATYSTREDGEPSRGEIAGAFGAVLFVVGLFWLAANALGF
jgi:hypothetical protein